MSFPNTQFNWNQAKAFLLTAQTGSLSAAAQLMQVSQPTLSRQVSALEASLGVVLFERVGRGLSLTPSGQELLEHVEQMSQAADQFMLTATGQSDQLAGEVCITATDVLAYFVLPPLVAKLRQVEPGIHIEVIASNTASDLLRREADIAVRSFRPTQPDLVAKKLTDVEAFLYATPAYLGALNNPTTFSGFAQADFIGFVNNTPYLEALNEMGFGLNENNFPVVCENHLIHWELTKQGVGVGVMPAQVGNSEPLVKRILPNLPGHKSELWLVAHREVRTSRRVRRVFDFLSDQLMHIQV